MRDMLLASWLPDAMSVLEIIESLNREPRYLYYVAIIIIIAIVLRNSLISEST